MREQIPPSSSGDGQPRASLRLDRPRDPVESSSWHRPRQSALYSPVPLLDPEPLVGDSDAIRRVGDLVDTAAQNTLNLLVQGESGVGKSLVAQKVHAQSARGDNWLIVVNCELIDADDLESLLLGTMASSEGTELGGIFDVASGGTLLLDRIEALGPQAQARLDHILETHSFDRLAEEASPPLGVRLVSTVTPNLQEDQFRRRLYDRLSQFSICIPPLRDRPGDILRLARHFLRRHTERKGTAERSFSTAAEDALRRHTWPGNVRELENAVERAAGVADGEVVAEDDLLLSIHDAPGGASAPADAGGAEDRRNGRDDDTSDPFSVDAPDDDGSIPTIEEMKQEAVERAYEACNRNVDQAAVELGIGRSTMYRMLKRYGIK